ncbi:MAG: Ldh family oxidoreductase [Rhodospirillales bacterium]|jgi:LDH2 family malate/lactate/ureidoglycolate dehydrogenase|nr:Ldh family oxidoreductase [Rhodospirillales bacterium]MDP6882562.1 Ldh family oxidoreductase [Rhodospirillales bacterium]
MPPRYSLNSLDAFATKLYVALGLEPDDAAIAARCLIRADLRGFATHGLGCIPNYAVCLREGRYNPRPEIVIESRMPWAISVDGDNGVGHVTATRAMAAALEAARTVGIGVASVRHTNHIGAAGVYPLMAAEAGCIGMTMANSGASVAPWGSAERLLGTNPLAVAVPAGRHPPFVMDMATSTVARRKIFEAMRDGRPIPEGWALDADGRPTTDAAAARDGISLPFGGAKGSAISMLVDILGGVLSGAEFGGGVLSSMTNFERHCHSGNFHMAFKVEAFMPSDTFAQRMDTLIDKIQDLEPAEGFDEVRVAGQRGARLEDEYRAAGLPLNAKDVETLSKLGDELGVSFPDPLSVDDR